MARNASRIIRRLGRTNSSSPNLQVRKGSSEARPRPRSTTEFTSQSLLGCRWLKDLERGRASLDPFLTCKFAELELPFLTCKFAELELPFPTCKFAELELVLPDLGICYVSLKYSRSKYRSQYPHARTKQGHSVGRLWSIRCRSVVCNVKSSSAVS